MTEIKPLSIKEELTLEEAEKLLIKTVNFGDFLAEKLKEARLSAKFAESVFDQAKQIKLTEADGKDADTRKLQAKNACSKELTEYETADIEASFIQDLLKNNHAKSEALRTIVSSKKVVYEKTYGLTQT